MINVLTSFRFIAAFFVFLHHTVNPGMGFGERGVTYFFILSGFILAYRYYDKFYNRLDWNDVLSFFISRVSRIYPVHVLTFIAGVVLSFYAPTYFYAEHVIANFFLVQWIFPKSVFACNPAAWSLSVEMTFYILFPLLMFIFCGFVLRSKPVSQLKISTLLLSVCAIYLVQAAVVMVVKDTSPSMSLRWWLMYVSPFRAADFCIGMVLALIYLKCRNHPSQVGQAAGVFSKRTILFTVLEVCAVLGVMITFKVSIFQYNAAMFAVNYIPSLAALILVFSFQGGLLSKVLVHKVFVYLGEISFSFFMLHYFIIALVNGKFNIHGGISHLIIFCISIVLSILTYKFYEMPMRNIMRDLLSGYAKKHRSQSVVKPLAKQDFKA